MHRGYQSDFLKHGKQVVAMVWNSLDIQRYVYNTRKNI